MTIILTKISVDMTETFEINLYLLSKLPSSQYLVQFACPHFRSAPSFGLFCQLVFSYDTTAIRVKLGAADFYI